MYSYKGFIGKVKFDPDAKLLHGEVIGTNDVITFQADNAKDIEKEFKESIDDYLEFCQNEGKEPEKSYSGETRLRMGVALHKSAVTLANKEGHKSMNDWIVKTIKKEVNAPDNVRFLKGGVLKPEKRTAQNIMDKKVIKKTTKNKAAKK